MPGIALIVLAAGESKRLGQAKQLMEFGGKTLVEHIVDAGLSSKCSPIILVLGAEYERIKCKVERRPITILQNPQWSSGMGSSISLAAQFLQKELPEIAAAIIATCDQPFLYSSILNSLIDVFEKENCPIVASSYDGSKGVPALFASQLFPELQDLSADKGAKQIIQNAGAKARHIEFPEGNIDIDTKEDWQAFLEKANAKPPVLPGA